MRIRTIFSSLLCICFFPALLSGQSPAEMLAWLKKNITIHYLADPNTDNPQFRKIKPDSIAKLQNGIIFGTTDNNKMDKAAQLLTALFKEKSSDPKDAMLVGKDGDLRLQETVYYSMQITGKPINIFFVNDVVTGIQAKYVSQYKFYLAGNIMYLALWPGTFPWQSPYAGSIALGEFLGMELRQYKEMFVAMVAQVGLHDFAPAKKTAMFRWKYNAEGDEPLFNFVTNDTRRVANQGIADGFSLYFSELLRKDIDKWKSGGAYYFLGRETTRSGEDLSVIEETPAKFTVQTRLLEYNKNNTGLKFDQNAITVLGIIGQPVSAVFSDFYFYTENLGRYRYALLNDLHIGELCYEFMRQFGIKKFVEMLRFNNDELIKAAPAQKTELIFQNMCLVMLAGRNTSDLLNGKLADGGKVVYGIALYDNYGYGDVRNPKGSFSTAYIDDFWKNTGAKHTNDALVFVMAHYLEKWQDKLRQELKKTDSRGLDVLVSGQ